MPNDIERPTPAPVVVALTAGEMEAGARMGRMHVDISAGQDRFEPERGDDRLKRRVEAARARIALAKHFGGTVPLRVRLHYSAQPAAQLVIAAPDDLAHFLITGRGPTFAIRGWAWGHEVAERGIWRTDVLESAWFLHDLRDIRTFVSEGAI